MKKMHFGQNVKCIRQAFHGKIFLFCLMGLLQVSFKVLGDGIGYCLSSYLFMLAMAILIKGYGRGLLS